MIEQQRDVFFGGEQPVVFTLGDVRLGPADRIVLVGAANRLMCFRVATERLDVVALDVLEHLRKDRRARAAIERVPLHKSVGHHSADMTVVLDE